MRAQQFYILLTVSFICFLLSLTTVFLSQSNQLLREQIEAQREPLTELHNKSRILDLLVKDIAQVAEKEKALRPILTENGYRANFPNE